jgi:hypothetical protein
MPEIRKDGDIYYFEKTEQEKQERIHKEELQQRIMDLEMAIAAILGSAVQ